MKMKGAMQKRERMNKLLLTLACLVALCIRASAQRPPWIRGDMPQQSNASYYFKVTQGEGRTRTEARQNALLELVGELSRSQGVIIKGQDILQTLSESRNGSYNETTRQQSLYRFETEGFNTCFDVADEYYEGNSCWLLFEVAYNPARVRFDKVEFTTDYKGSALWRSLIVPGWGQMYKRSMGKGITILSLQVATIAGICACSNLSNSYYDKAKTARNNSVRESYLDKGANYRNVRNVFIGAAGAVYVYNLIDALAGKGAKRYKKVQISPYMGMDAKGLSFNITF